VILDLGCGSKKRPGAIGVDINLASGADVIHDLDVYPYPFETSTADEIYLDNVLEHLVDVVATLEEIHRIGKPECLVRIDVPYFRSRWSAVDPTHRHAFTADSLGYFDPSHPFFNQYHYSSARFTVQRVLFNDRFPSDGVRALIARAANRWPERYEQHVAPILPLDELTFLLRVLKD
jgi:SAM-dependent methyltransferase